MKVSHLFSALAVKISNVAWKWKLENVRKFYVLGIYGCKETPTGQFWQWLFWNIPFLSSLTRSAT